MAVKYQKLGPGELTIGEVGTPLEIACQMQGVTVEWDVSKDDDVLTLCGDTVPGASTFAAKLTGKAFQDLDDAAGLVAFSWTHKGETVPITFVPSTAAGATVTGNVVMSPMNIGGEESGKNMESDIEWPFVGDPQLDQTAGGARAGVDDDLAIAG